jgi:hypothetical protein
MLTEFYRFEFPCRKNEYDIFHFPLVILHLPFSVRAENLIPVESQSNMTSQQTKNGK